MFVPNRFIPRKTKCANRMIFVLIFVVFVRPQANFTSTTSNATIVSSSSSTTTTATIISTASPEKDCYGDCDYCLANGYCASSSYYYSSFEHLCWFVDTFYEDFSPCNSQTNKCQQTVAPTAAPTPRCEESALLDELRRRRTRRKNSEIRRVTVASIPAERYVVATAVLLRAVSLCRSGLRAKIRAIIRRPIRRHPAGRGCSTLAFRF